MSRQPLVSIIVPTYNRAHLIGETLESLLAQTYTNWECIVVDDGSTDDTSKILATYIGRDTRIQYFHRPESLLKGGNAARNYGFELSKGKFIQWFDDDDIMLPEFLRLKVSAFKKEIDFVICTGYYFKYEISERPIVISVKSSLFKEYALFRSKIFTPSVLFKKSFLKNKSLFRTDMLRAQETEFFCRLFFETFEKQYRLVEVPLFLYRQHDDTKTTQNNAYNESFKSSEIFVAEENLKRGIKLNDVKLIQFFYKVLINFLFRAIEFKDERNSKHILNHLFSWLKYRNSFLAYQLYFFGNLFRKIGRGSYKMEMYFKAYTVKNV